MPLLVVNRNGLYCPQADIYIDPDRAVERAIITHGHTDHARKGHKHYLCHPYTALIIKHRLGYNLSIESKEYGESFFINGVKFSLHPAGHVIGSAQVRIEYKGEVWVVTGDYKTIDDRVSTPFELVNCNYFITECTFGLPIYQFPTLDDQIKQMTAWVKENQEADLNSVFLAYSLGKAQRLAAYFIDHTDATVLLHPTISALQKKISKADLFPYPLFRKGKGNTKIILVPPSAGYQYWLQSHGAYRVAACSGWMQLSARKKSSGVDAGFPVSDHADWNELIKTIKATGADHIYTTHGYTESLAQYITSELRLNGLTLEHLAVE